MTANPIEMDTQSRAALVGLLLQIATAAGARLSRTEIATVTAVGPRTVSRDIETLRSSGLPIVGFADGYTLDPEHARPATPAALALLAMVRARVPGRIAVAVQQEISGAGPLSPHAPI